MLYGTGDRDFQALNSSVVFPEGSMSGDTVCVDIRIFDIRGFNKLRIFSIHVAIIEFDRGLTIHRAYAWVHIFNVDGEFQLQ